MKDPVELAKKFHEAYERLAPSFGYVTRQDTKEFNPDSTNGKLMTVVCEEICTQVEKEAFDAGYKKGLSDGRMYGG